jgi:hypothetical protein
MFNFDLLYLVGHPLTAAIHTRHLELEESARGLPGRSPEQKRIEKRIGKLEEYCLPKSDAQDLKQNRMLLNRAGEAVGELHSVRRRFAETRRGRPAQWRIQVRAALEEKLADPKVTWRQLAEKFKFRDSWREGEDGVKRLSPAKCDLERQVRLLRDLLLKEGILEKLSFREAPALATGLRIPVPQFVDLTPYVEKLLKDTPRQAFLIPSGR